MLHYEGRARSDCNSLRALSIVRSLLISLFGPPRSGCGFLRINALLPTLTLFVAFLTTIPAFRDGFPFPVVGTALTPPSSGGSETVVGLSIMPSWFCSCQSPPLHADPPRPPCSWGLSSFMYIIFLSVCILVDAPLWFSSTRSIDYKSKNVGNFSLRQTTVRND